MNYSLQEYANDVVSSIQEACDETNVPHPDLITEAGRSMVAHHSVLIFDVLGVSELRIAETPEAPSEDDPRVVQDLWETWNGLSRKNPLEGWHDLTQLKEEAGTLFALGYLDMRARARVERLFQAGCEKLLRIVRELPQVPEDLEDLEKTLADTYFGNFSMFQSMPDHWGFKQLFPVMPIHRLEQEPTRRGIFADLTCDSDGKIGLFIDQHDVRDTLELHSLNGQPYYIGVFLVGAYQEILGDLHNLFGDTHAVHVRVDDDGKTHIEHVVEADKVREVLDYVEYDSRELVGRVQTALAIARERGDLSARGVGEPAPALRGRPRRDHLPLARLAGGTQLSRLGRVWPIFAGVRLVACRDCHAQYDVTDVAEPFFDCRCGANIRNEAQAAVDAAVQRCSACGALLAEKAEHCDYCRAAVVRAGSLSLICPECYARNEETAKFCVTCGVEFRPEALPHEQDAPLACPACGGDDALAVRGVGGVWVRECGKCNGLWVPGDRFDSLVQRAIEAARQRSGDGHRDTRHGAPIGRSELPLPRLPRLSRPHVPEELRQALGRDRRLVLGRTAPGSTPMNSSRSQPSSRAAACATPRPPRRRAFRRVRA